MSDTHTETTTEAPDDIRGALAMAFDEATAPPERADDTPTEARESAQERARDASGRFAKAEAAEAAEEAPEAPVEAPKAETQPKAEDETAKALAYWPAAARETLSKLPPDALKPVLDRVKEMEADYTRKTQETALARREWEPVAQLFAPHADAMRQRGLTPASTIQGWYQAERTLMSGGDQAANFVAQIISGYKLDKGAVARALGLPTSSQADAMPPDPANVTNATVATLPPHEAQRLAAIENYIRAQHQEQQNQAATRVVSEIEQFAGAKDASGNLLYPHFREVEEDMARLATLTMNQGRQPVLKDLYENAVWSNSATREKLLAEQHAAAEAQRVAAEQKRQEEAKAKAEKARRAASSVTGTPGPGQSAKREPESLREQLANAFDEKFEAA